MQSIVDNVKAINAMLRELNIHSSEEVNKKIDKISTSTYKCTEDKIYITKKEIDLLIDITNNYLYLYMDNINNLKLKNKTSRLFDLMALSDDIPINNKSRYIEYLELNYNSILKLNNKLKNMKKENESNE